MTKFTHLNPHEHFWPILWSHLAEGEDYYAYEFLRTYGMRRASEMVGWEETDHTFILQGSPAHTLTHTAGKRWRKRSEKLFEDSGDKIWKSLVTGMKTGDSFLSWQSEEWPTYVDDLGEMTPHSLWIRGDISLLSRPAIAIVGSRAPSHNGLHIARTWAGELARAGYVIVSGGAFGIDAAAHRGALEAGGATVAILASGISRAYPTSHEELFESILCAGGAIMSENPPLTYPHRHRFLSRNRLIAALSMATLVIDAPIRSGSLNTAHHAIRIGRPLGAVPGAIHDPYAAGCLELLREGATCIRHSEDVRELVQTYGRADGLFSLPVIHDDQEKKHTPVDGQAMIDQLSADERRVLDMLRPQHFVSADTLSVEAGVPIAFVIATVSKLTALTLAREKNGQFARNILSSPQPSSRLQG